MIKSTFIPGFLTGIFFLTSAPAPSEANNIAKKFTFRNANLVTTGAGLKSTSNRSTDTAIMSLSGVGTSTVLKAFLYYHGVVYGMAENGALSSLHGETVNR